MNKENDTPDQGIEEKLFEAWRQERKFYDFRGAARFLIWLVALLAVDLLIDWQIFFRERWETPGILLLLVNLIVLGWVLWKEWLRHRKHFDPVRVALEVENKHPQLRSVLVSYSQFKDMDPEKIQASPTLLKAMRDQAISLTKPLNFKEVVDFNQLKNLGLVCFVTLLCFSAAGLQWKDHMRALFMRLIGENVDYPTNTTITKVVVDSGKTSKTLDLASDNKPFAVKAGGEVEILVSVDTIIVYMSDNGHSEETGNRIRVDNHKSGHPKGHFYGASGGGFTGKWTGQKGSFLEGGIRVPAVISFPAKLPQGETRDQIVTAMDWLPTVMELCGLEGKKDDPELDGHSVLPLIRSAKAESGYGEVLHFQWHTQWAVRMGEWKLLGRGTKASFLGNLNDEQPERKNYAKEKPELVARLLEMHGKWSAEVKPAN